MSPTRRAVQPDDLFRIVTIPDAQISPDGRRIAFVKQRVDVENDTYTSAIWLIDADGANPVQLTAGTKRDTSPRWSPAGSRIAFLSDRDEGQQLYVIPVDGGEPRQLTKLPDGAGVAVWSPDGTRIAFSAGVQREPAPSDKDAKERWQQRPKPVEIIQYKRDGSGYTNDRRWHIFVVDADGTGEPRQITDGIYDERDPAWSPDGRTLAFASARHETREYDTLVDLFLVPAEGGEPSSLARLGRLTGPAFSPDGREVAVYATTDDGKDWSAHAHVWLVPIGGGEARNLMPDLDRSANVMPPPFVTPRPGWTADGRILFSISDRGNVSLIAVDAAEGTRSTVLAGERQLTTWSLSADAGKVAFVFTDLETPADVGVANADGSGEARLTRVNEELLNEIEYAPPVRRTFTTLHGEIDGWVMRASDAPKPGPLLVTIHGGPHGAFGSVFPQGSYYWQLAAAKGWTILAVNPTGSGTYGKQFAQTLLGQWGEYDLPEQLAAVDALISEGIVDGERLAVTGYSYGGYMTSWTVGHTDRFKAAIIGAPVTNLESFHGTSDIGLGFGAFEMGGPLIEQREVFRRLSPVNYIDQVVTPCLILHGEADDRCPIGQGEEFFIGLRAQGKTAEMVRYPGGSHLFVSGGRPSHRLDYAQRVLDWIERYTLAAARERELAATGD